MICPFCRSEMLPGGLQLTARPLHPDPIHWVPLNESTGKYAAWEQELTEREQIIREKELELKIN